jgi:hypothetical protein
MTIDLTLFLWIAIYAAALGAGLLIGTALAFVTTRTWGN